jgi:hypothetical protein
MNCPKCSHPQSTDEAQFCAQCGFPVNESQTVTNQVETPETEKPEGQLSPRRKGVRQGFKLILLSIVLIPAYVLLAALFPANDVLVESHVSDTAFEKISEAVLFTIFLCGLARILYAYFFEQSDSDSEQKEERVVELNAASSRYALPPSHSIPVSGFGAWRRETGEVVTPTAEMERNRETVEKGEMSR